MEFSVLDPRGVREPIKRTPLCERLETLEGKTIYCVSQDRPKFTEEVANRLARALPTSKVVYRRKPGWIRKEDEDLREEILSNADAMVYGTSMGGGSGMAAVTWVSGIEKKGIPSVYLAGELYGRNVAMSAIMRGLPAMRTVSVKLMAEDLLDQAEADQQFASIIARVVDALTVPINDEERRSDDIVTERPPRIAMIGTHEQVQDFFADEGWSDGLPIVPPSEERVTEMLRGTHHAPDEVVTTSMHPEELTATVEKVAIVGAMAGCKPEYMPVLLALVETWGSSAVFAQAARSDSTFSLMTVVNGPVRNEIAMNKGANALGPGNRANATIGRFLRLAILCLGGSLPGVTDMSAQGSPVKYGFCFPEHEEESPWVPFHVSSGYKADASVVSLWAGAWCHWSFHADLDQLARAFATFPQSGGAVLMSLEAARHYGLRLKMEKAAVENYILEHALAAAPDRRPTWYSMDVPPFAKPMQGKDAPGLSDPSQSIKIVVVGGETSIPVAQAWHFNLPVFGSVDKWR